MLLVNKDVSAGTPVVTPVPPPTTDAHRNGPAAIKPKEEPMEVSGATDLEKSSATVPAETKTEVLDTSQGKNQRSSCVVTKHCQILHVTQLLLHFSVIGCNQ